MCMLTKSKNITLIDGDKLEKRNLNRQLFNDDDIGNFKAEALAQRYKCEHFNKWFSSSLMPFEKDDWLLVCVDNHVARKEALMVCDYHGCRAIFAANEKFSAEAYFYKPSFRDTPLDPRIYYPEIETDRTNNPVAESIGCTGEEQEKTPQLVSANFAAAALLQSLFVLWAMESHKIDADAQKHLPFMYRSNLSKLESFRVREQMKKE
jgi:molybdopterin/thiamine biosynthesis adenylyltransferase